MTKSKDDLGDTKRLMGALVRMKPKPHEDMKVGKKAKAKKKRVQKARLHNQ
jgi:hypothetical protein